MISILRRLGTFFFVALLFLSLAAPVCLAADDENLAVYKQWDRENAAGRRAYEGMRYSEAATLYQTALATAERLQYRGPLGTSSYGLARCYHKLHMYPQAEENYKQAIEYFDSSRGSYYLGTCVHDYAELLRETGRWQQAAAEESRLKVTPRLDKVKQALNAQNGQSSNGQSSANIQPYWNKPQYSTARPNPDNQANANRQMYSVAQPNGQPKSNGPQPYSYGPYSSNMFRSK